MEVGANDGIQQSNTHQLQVQKGWRGILIEPAPSAFEKCKVNRGPNNIYEQCVLSNPQNEGTEIYGDFDGDLRASVDAKNWGINNCRLPNQKVVCRTLGSILNQHNVTDIDLMSIDVEGHEIDVINGMDFTYCKPKAIVIEVTTANLGTYQYNPSTGVLGDMPRIFTVMREKGYYGTQCLSNFTKTNNPMWNEQHQDYLFERVYDVWQ